MSYDLGSAVGYLDLDTSKWKNGMKSAFSDLKAFGDQSTSTMDRIASAGSGMAGVGKNMSLAFTIPLMTMGAGALKVASDFESGMSEVKAITQATTEDMAAMKDVALELGATTAFSASEAAEGMANLGSAGFNTKEIISAMPGMLDLAAASGTELATASEIAATALRGFGLEAGESGRVADIFAKAAADTNAGVEDMGEAMKYIAPVANAMKYSIEETAAAVGILSDAGIKGSQAGTTLRGALSRLAKPSEEATKVMDALGFQAYDSSGQMKGMETLIGDLGKSMEGLTDQQKQNAIVQIFGQEAMSGMMVLMDAGPDKINKLTTSFENSEGAAKAMAETMLDNFQGSVEELGGAIETLAIAVGDILMPVVRKMVEGITGFVNWLNSASDSTKKIVVAIGAILAAAGPLLLIGGKFLLFIVELQKVIPVISGLLTGAGASIGAMALPILGIIAAVAALKLAWDNNFGGIQDKAKIALIYIESIVKTFLGWFKEVWEGDLTVIRETAVAIFTGLELAFSGLLEIIMSLFGVFAGLFSGNWEIFWQSLKNVFWGILDLITGLWSAMWETLKLIAMGYVTVVQGVATGILNGVKGVFTGAKDAMLTIGADIFNWLKDGMASAWEGLVTWVDEKLAWFQEKLRAILDTIANIASANEGGGGGGSFALGLPYVPYNGFEATLHEGERVLTKAENKAYNEQAGGSGGDTYIFQSPKALTPAESARQMKKAKKELLLGF